MRRVSYLHDVCDACLHLVSWILSGLGTLAHDGLWISSHRRLRETTSGPSITSMVRQLDLALSAAPGNSLYTKGTVN